ncbi:unnamed protein product [Macrosiphum euphorbiae]|uniref:Uncharacterized protein n=1 Tax=Macrosiphum euphorbiae TaxID=13131 RepID=A0AAV0X1L2_9HEMI|nr:unnamed protein product [Macrosiphum euphorbiae]
MEANAGSSRCTESSDWHKEGRSLIDACDRNNTSVGCPLRCGLAESFRWTPELTDDSPVNNSVVKMDSPPVPPVLTTEDTDDQTDTLKYLQQHISMIEALDLAVDHRVATTVGLQSRPLRENAVIFRSSAEPSIHSPVYGSVKSVPPVQATEIQPNPVRYPDRRRSLWKRSTRFMRKSMVNAARRICFCQSFVDLE